MARKPEIPDCQWIWQLMIYGLLKGAFRPADEICSLRSVVRQREAKVQEQSRCIQLARIPLNVVSPPASRTDPAAKLVPNGLTFCLNHNLPGAASQNGMGMRRRFTFTANFTGYMALGVQNGLGQEVSDAYVEVKAIDGPIIVAPEQYSRWKLKPDAASEVSLLLEVPGNTPSYLTLETHQDN